MKRILITLAALAGTTWLAHATLILSNSFAYADGALITVSAGSPLGVWTNHSGTSGQVDVSGGVVNLTQAEAEDVSSGLPGGPYSTGKLYASFKVNFSALPGGNGTYFFHFRDLTTTDFRGKVFATATNSPAGSFRLGVAVGGQNNPALIPSDLSTNAEYKVVLRYDLATTNATLWLNPTSEASVINRADAIDGPSTVEYPMYSVCFRQSGTTPGMGTLTLDDLLIGTTFADVQTIGGAPSISGLAAVHLPADSNTGDMPFLVSDVETPATSLTLDAYSDNLALVPQNPANLIFGGSGENRTLKVIPAAGEQGLANIDAVVTDGDGLKATNSFKVYVGEPTISTIPNQMTPKNTALGPIAFTVNDNETDPGTLGVSKSSSSPGLIPDANISIVNLGGQNRTVTLSPLADATGVATITLTVNDGTWNISKSFSVTVYPKLGLLINEPFNYADGSIVANSGTWINVSGTSGDCQVLNGKLVLSASLTEDIATNFPSLYIDVNSGTILYSSFKVNFTGLPTSNEYFAHYRDATTSNFRARVFGLAAGTPGKYRIAIANTGFTTASVPRDLSTNTTYLVVTRYNVGTGESMVWVNPVAEQVGGVAAIDTTAPITLYYFDFRQTTSMGTLTVDDLKIGTEFGDVFTPVASDLLSLQILGGQAVLSWTNPFFALESAPTVGGPYATIPGATSPYTNSLSAAQYFRLRY
jgi:hypothetical protein